MKRYLIIGGIAGVVVTLALVALLAAGVVSYRVALAQTQPNPSAPNGGFGNGMMGRSGRGMGMMGSGSGRGMMGYGDGTTGPMHAYMISALAEKLGLTTEELQAKIEAGETPYEVAQAKGLTDEQIRQLWLDAHDQALDQAVAAGVLTQKQADWMDSRMEQMGQNGFGPGFGPCHEAGGRSNSQQPSQ